MKLYTINGISVSTIPINGTQEVEIQTIDGDNPLNYLNKRIKIFEGGYNVEVPSEKELSDELRVYNLLVESQELKKSLASIEDYIIENELKKIGGM